MNKNLKVFAENSNQQSVSPSTVVCLYLTAKNKDSIYERPSMMDISASSKAGMKSSLNLEKKESVKSSKENLEKKSSKEKSDVSASNKDELKKLLEAMLKQMEGKEPQTKEPKTKENKASDTSSQLKTVLDAMKAPSEKQSKFKPKDSFILNQEKVGPNASPKVSKSDVKPKDQTSGEKSSSKKDLAGSKDTKGSKTAVNGKAEDQAGNSKPKEAKTGEGEKHSKHVMISAPGGWYNTLFL